MENNLELAKMIIRFYNLQAGCSLRADGKANLDVVLGCLNRVNDSIKVKNHIREWVKVHEGEGPLANRFEECMDAIEVAEPVKKNNSESNVSNDDIGSQVQYGMGLLEQAVVQLISNMQSEKIEQNIMSSVQDSVRSFIASEYGTIERKVVTIIDGKKYEPKGAVHEAFDEVVTCVSNDVPVFLTGPAGSGKNVLCKQVAESLGLNFYFTNAVTQEYKLTGFTDAMGNYQETQFYKAFTEGGLFMLDEMDASIPEVLTILNAAIANKYFDFPAPIGYVEAHPNFRVIAAGNTTGHGANMKYVGRNQLDMATLDRFGVVEIDYSKTIEDSVSLGNKELLKFCRDYRKASDKAGLQVVVSYRGIGNIAKMSQALGNEKALKMFLVKGMEKDDINIIINGMKVDNEYTQALRNIVSNM